MQWLNKNQMPGLESHLKIGTVWCVYLSCTIYEFQVAIRVCTEIVDVTTDLKWNQHSAMSCTNKEFLVKVMQL